MAYKSRVSNQYMGAGFAGQVTSARTTDATDLINTLSEISPKLEKIGATYVEEKNKAAEQKIKELFLTKDPATVRDEILSGQHPELSSQYVQKTVSFHTGKHEAALAISEIEKNKNQYDFRDPNQNLSSFYKQFLPDFKDKNASYALGFASIFNEYKANAAIKDGQERSKYAQEKKIEQGVVILSAAKGTDIIDQANALKIKVPPEEGGKKPRELYTNEEVNDVIIAWAKNKLSTARTPEEIDEALLVLKTPRQKDSDGKTVVPSLYDTKRNDVSDLVQKLNVKRVSLENQSRADKQYKRNEDKSNIWLQSVTPKSDGTMPTLDEINKLGEKLKLIDPSDVSGYSNFIAYHKQDPKDRVIVDPAIVTKFNLNIARGEYETKNDLINAYVSLGITGGLDKYLQRWRLEYADRGKTKAVFDVDSNYINGKKGLEEILKVKYPKDALGNTQFPVKFDAAKDWYDEQVLLQEEEWKSKGVTPTNSERRAFALQLKKDASELFSPAEGAKPKEIVTSKEMRKQEKAQQAQVELKAEEETARQQALKLPVTTTQEGYTLTVGDVVSNITGNIKTLGKQKLSEMRIEGIISQKELFEQVNKPKIQKYIKTVLGSSFDANFMAALPQQDYNNIVNEIANSFGMIKKIPKGAKNAKEMQQQNIAAMKVISNLIRQSVETQ